ncbi:hypothetical protein EN753_35250, partial [Mesorhizobium sp. M2A.F.Ca.ET.029.05.1.1]
MCAWAGMTAEGMAIRDSAEARKLAHYFDAIPGGKPFHTFPGIALVDLAERFAGDHGDRQRDID